MLESLYFFTILQHEINPMQGNYINIKTFRNEKKLLHKNLQGKVKTDSETSSE